MTTSDEQPQDAVFLRARFAGGRFDAHSLPLELLPDLASYRRLVVEVAKHLFKSTHGDRVRVPKGFEESFQIAVARLEGGSSAVAELVVPLCLPASQTHLFAPHPEFEQARDLIAHVIRSVASGNKVPESFPPNLVGLFNPFGQNLEQDEFLEMSSPGSEPVRYTDGIRRAIVLSAEHIIESGVDDEFTLNGGLVHTGTVHVLDVNRRNLDFQSGSQFEFDEAYRRAGSRVRLVGNGLFDPTGTLRRLLAVSIDFDRPAFHLELRSAFEGAIQAAQADSSPDATATGDRLRSLLSVIESCTDPNLELGRPFVYVLDDGEISVEWTKESWEANIQMTKSADHYKLHALNISTRQMFWLKVDSANHVGVKEGMKAFFDILAVAPHDKE